MKNWITFPRWSGRHSRQAHCDLPEGTYEREFGREGFFGPATHIYHQNPPIGWESFEGDMKPRAYDLNQQKGASECPWDVPEFLYNNSARIRFWRVEGKMPDLVRNCDGDELLFIHSGSGELFCDFGHMSFRDGDYIVFPRSTAWRLEVAGSAEILLIEATNDGYRLPDKGMVGPHAVFDQAMLDVPEINEQFKAQQHKNKTRVIVKRAGKKTVITYPYNPLDAAGWHGDNLPVRINWRDIRPLMSHRYHLPPSAHTTFLANRFVVCTFVPRLIETDTGALKVPFYHSNNDYDEFIFYHKGEFFSRDNIKPGMTTLHPAGFPHGPHPKAYELSLKSPKKETDEVAVMVDTRDYLNIADGAGSIEWKEYVDSWKKK